MYLSDSPCQRVLLLTTGGAGATHDVRALLELYDWQVVQTSDEQQIAGLLPDVVLIEAAANADEGLSCCRRLKEDNRTRNLPVLLLLAEGGAAERTAVFAAGAADYIVLPLVEAELLARVEACLARYQATKPDMSSIARNGTMSPQVTGSGERESACSPAAGEMALLAAAFDQVHESAYVIDADARILCVTEMACHTLGYLKEELAGAPMSRIDPTVTAEWLRCGWEHFIGADSLSIEGTHYHKDGRSIPVRVRAYPIKFGGKYFSLSFTRSISDGNLTGRELLLEHAINHAAEAVYVMDVTGRITYVNEASCRQLDYCRSELLAKFVPDIDAAISAEEFAAMLADINAKGPTRGPFRSRHRRRDGSTFPVEIEASVFNIGAARYVLTLVRDITERVAVEQALHASEQVFRAMVENSPDYVARYDRDCRRLYVNPAAIAMSGRSASELVGAMPSDNGVMCDRVAYVERLRHVFDSGETVGFAGPYHHHGYGQTRWADVRMVPERDRDGRVATVIAISRDINDLKDSERGFQALAENSPDNILRLDRQGRVLYANSRMIETWRVFGNVAVFGRTVSEAIGTTDAHRSHLLYMRAMEMRTSIEGDFVLPDAGGGQQWHNIAVVPEFDERGEVVGALAIGRDVTERRRTEQQLRQLNRALNSYGECRRALIRADDEASLLADICRIVCDEAGYCMAWIGRLRAGEESGIAPLAWAGAEDGYLECAMPIWNSAETEHDWTSIVLREGRISGVADFATDPAVAAWREEALRRGYRSRIAVPLKDGHGRILGALIVYAATVGAFNGEAVRLLEGLADDLAFGVQALRTRVRQREAEAACLASEGLFRSLVENTPDLVVRYDRELQRTYVNPAWQHAAGLSSGEVVGRPMDAIRQVPRPVVDVYVEALRKAREEGTRQDVEFSWINARGEELHLEYTVVPELDHDGLPVGVLAVGRDITARKHEAMNALAHTKFLESMDRINRITRSADGSQRMMRDVLNEVLAIFECDRAYLFYPCDPAAPSWIVPMECTRPEYPSVLTDGQETLLDDEVRSELLTILATDGPVAFDGGEGHQPIPEMSGLYGFRSHVSMVLRPMTGAAWKFGVHQCSHARIWTSAELRLLDAIGRRLTDGLTAMLALNRLTESERRYREIFENTTNLIEVWQVNTGGQFSLLDVDPAWEQITGLKRDMVIGLTLANHSGYAAKELVAEQFHACVNSGASSHFEIEMQTPKGPRQLETSLRPVFDASGVVYRLIAIGQDVTGRKVAERQLRESHEMLRELAAKRETAREEEKRHLAREIHDELGQQLTALRMGISALNIGFGTDHPAIRESAQRLLGLSDRAIREVRNIATTLRPAVLDSGICAAIEWLVSGFTTQTGLVCRASIAESLPKLDEHSAVTVFRVAQESLTNIARHARCKTVDVVLNYRDGVLLLEIRDDGCGFEPQAKHRYSFGLAGMRERALVLGGNLTVNSRPGAGTTVQLTIRPSQAESD